MNSDLSGHHAILRTGEQVEGRSDLQFNAPVFGVCRTHRHNPAVYQLAQAVIGHARELVAGDERLLIAETCCTGHAATSTPIVSRRDPFSNRFDVVMVIRAFEPSQ